MVSAGMSTPGAFPALSKAQIKTLARLHHKKYRNDDGLFVAEGAPSVREALRYGRVQCLLLDAHLTETAELLTILELAREAMVPVFSTTTATLERLCEAQTPQGLAAICPRLTARLDDIVQCRRPVVFLDGLQDPGNVGAIIRTAAALSAGGVICAVNCADVFNAKTVRATEGGLWKLPLAWDCDPAPTLAALRDKNYKIYACTADPAGADFLTSPLTADAVYMFGNEKRGLSAAALAQATATLHVPIQQDSESLNVAVSAGILLYHAYRLIR